MGSGHMWHCAFFFTVRSQDRKCEDTISTFRMFAVTGGNQAMMRTVFEMAEKAYEQKMLTHKFGFFPSSFWLKFISGLSDMMIAQQFPPGPECPPVPGVVFLYQTLTFDLPGGAGGVSSLTLI